MTFDSLKFRFWGDATNWNFESAFVPVSISSFKTQILDDLTLLYTSSTASTMIDNILLNNTYLGFVSLRQADSGGSPAYAIGTSRYPANAFSSVQLDYTKADEVHWFNSVGELVRGERILTLAHELKHIESGLNDPIDPVTQEALPDSVQNAAGFDFAGAMVRAQNGVAADMSMTGQDRVSYGGAVYGSADLSSFRIGDSYTDGNTVSVVRRGGGDNNNIDHSERTSVQSPQSEQTDLADLLFGEGGDDIIYGGGGRDYIYGGTGADFIHGGYRSGSANAQPTELDGFDTAGYMDSHASTTMQVTIGGAPVDTRYQALPDYNRAIFVTDSDGVGIDTLVSIEQITGTTGDDTVLIRSLAPDRFAAPDTGLGGLRQIDLGQQAQAGDLVDLFESEATRIVIDGDDMSIERIAEPGVLLVVSGAEEINATSFGDEIIVHADDGVRIDGKGGDDIIKGGLGRRYSLRQFG